MSPLLEFGAVAGVGCGMAGLARLLVQPAPKLAQRVRPYSRGGGGVGLGPDFGRTNADAKVIGSFFRPLVESCVRWASRRIESRSDSELETALYQAGRVDMTVDEFRVSQAVHGLVGASVGGAFGAAIIKSPIVTLVLVVAVGVWASTRVRSKVDSAIELRRARIRLELGTVAQLLALAVRSGSGPLQAVQRFADRGNGLLAAELRSVTVSVRSGSRESDAFRRAAELTPAPEAARLFLLFANGVDRGADMASALLNIADDVRDSRRDEIKRKSIKARSAMLLPTIGILAPVMLLFIAAPLPSVIFGNR